MPPRNRNQKQLSNHVKTPTIPAAMRLLGELPPKRNIQSVPTTLAIELARAGQIKPGLEVLGDGAVQQSSLGMARV